MEIDISIDDNGCISVRELIEDTYHRRVITPGTIVDGEWVDTDVSDEPAEIQEAAAFWTADVKAGWRATQETMQAELAYTVTPLPEFPPLNRFQFEALVMAIGLSMTGIEAAIDGMGLDAFERAVAISRLRNATMYNRDHALVEVVRLGLGLPVADLDPAWKQAAALK